MGKIESRVVTTGRDIIDFIEKNGLADAYVTVGCEGYVADPEDEIVIGFNGENLMLVDACYYEGFCD